MKLPKTFMPEKDLEKNIKKLLNPESPKPKQLTDYGPVWLEDICCKDEYGDTIEHYDKIFIKTNLATTNKERSSSYFTLPGAISFFERQKGDVFLPSAALTCNILAKLYELRHYEEMENLLLKYSSHKNDGWHLQNTLIDWKGQRTIHYPGYSEVPKKIKKREMNYNRDCKILGFDIGYVKDIKLEFFLKESDRAGFIKDLTGLENPEILVDIGDYFRRPARVWFPDNLKEAKPSTVWIGCRNDSFDIYLASGVNYSGPARGVYTEIV